MPGRGFAKQAGLLALLCALAAPLPAKAVALLQIYLEGATYDAASESWVVSGAGSARLWAIGNVAGPGGKGTIKNVRLAVSYAAAEGVAITLTPSTTGGYEGFFDPSTSPAAAYLQTVTDGSRPLLSDGAPLPGHGSFGEGIYWQEFGLGDFSLTDSPMADFIYQVPDAPLVAGGQISVYEISATGVDELHFDLYDSYAGNPKGRLRVSEDHSVFAPFSHEASLQVSEPGPAALLSLGLVALMLVRSRRVSA
jgi:hypothetical protein